MRAVTGPLKQDEAAACGRSELDSTRGPRDRVLGSLNDQDGTAEALTQGAGLFLALTIASRVSTSVSGVVSSPHPTQSSICLVECGSMKN